MVYSFAISADVGGGGRFEDVLAEVRVEEVGPAPADEAALVVRGYRVHVDVVGPLRAVPGANLDAVIAGLRKLEGLPVLPTRRALPPSKTQPPPQRLFSSRCTALSLLRYCKLNVVCHKWNSWPPLSIVGRRERRTNARRFARNRRGLVLDLIDTPARATMA